jgi:hypothetical protein
VCISKSSVRSLTVMAAGACAAASAGTVASAQSTATNLLSVYEQAGSSRCFNTAGCRIDFSTVSRNLKVLRVSCLIDVQTNGINALISDFELGNASSDQSSFFFGQYLAPMQLLSTAGPDQFYVANVETLHVVPAGYRPSVFVFTRINPSAPIAAQCSISGSYVD